METGASNVVNHYEGDTLVLDTIGMNDKTVVDIYRTPHAEKLHAAERWRKVSVANQVVRFVGWSTRPVSADGYM
jgi:hypothetical protein